MQYKYHNIIFDLDGTLINSGPGIIHAVQYALKKYDINETNMTVLKSFVGRDLLSPFTNLPSLSVDLPTLFPAGLRETGLSKVFSQDFASDCDINRGSLGFLGSFAGFVSSVFSGFGAREREGAGLELPELEIFEILTFLGLSLLFLSRLIV